MNSTFKFLLSAFAYFVLYWLAYPFRLIARLIGSLIILPYRILKKFEASVSRAIAHMKADAQALANSIEDKWQGPTPKAGE